MTGATTSTKLYLVLDAPRETSALERAKAIVTGVAPACVLLTSSGQAPFDAALVKALAENCQAVGIAVLIADDTHLARTVKADGVHLSWSQDLLERYTEARETLGKGSIVGIDAGASRHDAMTVAEAGADYVAFVPTANGDGQPARETELELVGWWAEIFEIPVVAFGAETRSEAHDYMLAGADFVAARVPAGVVTDATISDLKALTVLSGHEELAG